MRWSAEWKSIKGTGNRSPSSGCTTSHGVKGRRPTDLLREAPRPQEESQKTPNDHSEHRHDEEPILFADVLHPHPHCVQSHGHRESAVLASYRQPINVPNPKPKIRVRVMEKTERWRKTLPRVNIQSLCDVSKRLRPQHPSGPLAAAICTELRTSALPFQASPPTLLHPSAALCELTLRQGGGTAGEHVPGGLISPNPVSALL